MEKTRRKMIKLTRNTKNNTHYTTNIMTDNATNIMTDNTTNTEKNTITNTEKNTTTNTEKNTTTNIEKNAAINDISELREEFPISIDWEQVSRRNLSDDFMRKYWWYLNHDAIFSSHKNSMAFINEYHIHYNPLKILTQCLNILSEEFIEKHYKSGELWEIPRYQILSEEFMEKHINEINWTFVSIHQRLSERFMEKNRDILNWSIMSQTQKMSAKFIKKHKEMLQYSRIKKNKELSIDYNIAICLGIDMRLNDEIWCVKKFFDIFVVVEK